MKESAGNSQGNVEVLREETKHSEEEKKHDISFGAQDAADDLESQSQPQMYFDEFPLPSFTPVVDWLSYEPNFLYKEFAKD